MGKVPGNYEDGEAEVANDVGDVEGDGQDGGGVVFAQVDVGGFGSHGIYSANYLNRLKLLNINRVTFYPQIRHI